MTAHRVCDVVKNLINIGRRDNFVFPGQTLKQRYDVSSGLIVMSCGSIQCFT